MHNEFRMPSSTDLSAVAPARAPTPAPRAVFVDANPSLADIAQALLRPTDLPFDEQYRYVAFAPTRKPYPMDWSHEREWRWSAASA